MTSGFLYDVNVPLVSIIRADLFVGCQEDKPFGGGLGNQQAIEWILVQNRQSLQGDHRPACVGELSKSGFAEIRHRLTHRRQFPRLYSVLDRNLPQTRGTDVDFGVLIGQRGASAHRKLA